MNQYEIFKFSFAWHYMLLRIHIHIVDTISNYECVRISKHHNDFFSYRIKINYRYIVYFQKNKMDSLIVRDLIVIPMKNLLMY